MEQEFDSGTLNALRAAVLNHVARAGLARERVTEVVLAVHELAANAVAHGAGCGHIRMWSQPGSLCCQVIDSGPAGAGGGLAGESGGLAGGGGGLAGGGGGPAGAGGGLAGGGGGLAGGGGGGGDAADPWPVESGHGLWIVREVADQLDLRSGPRGTCATVSFGLP